MFLRFSILVACFAMTPGQVFGGLIVTMRPAAASYAAGTTAQVDLFVRSDSATPQAINGFDLSFDLRSPSGGNIGQSLPTGVTLRTPFLSNTRTLTGGTGIALNPTVPDNTIDAYVNGDGSTSVGSADELFFSMSFDIGAAAAEGTYDLRFVPGQFTFFADASGAAEISPVSFSAGSFLVVTAVPEPSSMALLGLVIAGATCTRHRARRKTRA